VKNCLVAVEKLSGLKATNLGNLILNVPPSVGRCPLFPTSPIVPASPRRWLL